jgi:hypothetical protein|tara:strand:- start:1242 stop:1874 length:633 start_codon:yes stop_codon:yes gene_type:complete
MLMTRQMALFVTAFLVAACTNAADNSAQEATKTPFDNHTKSDSTQKPDQRPAASSEIAWSQGSGEWQVLRHFKDTDKEYYSASSAESGEYMSLSILFTPKKYCEDGKSFIAAKLSSPTPFSARKVGQLTTQFDDLELRSFSTDYIFTEGSHIIWIDLPTEFYPRTDLFQALSVRTDDYLKGAPSRIIPLSGSKQALLKAQKLCYRLLLRM